MTGSDRFDGEIIWRGEPGYEPGRVDPVFNCRVPDRFPAAVVFAGSVEDVQRAVRLAAERDLKVSVRSGGHSWGAWGVRDDTVLIDLSRMTELRLADDGVTALVGPGVRGGQTMVPFLAERGRAFQGGHCPTVAVSGYLLQGGQGWNGRVKGWGAEDVAAIDVVTADGELVHATDEENADLLWAARGAGPGFFGVVVRWHLRTYPLPGGIWAANWVFRTEDFDDVLAWADAALDRCEDACEPVLACVPAYAVPPLEGVVPPDEHVLVMMATAMVESEEEARRVLAPLAEGDVLERALLHRFAAETTLREQFDGQEVMNPDDARYATDCMWTDARAAELAPYLRPVMTQAPSPQTFSIWYGWKPPARTTPMAFSLEARVYLATYAIWRDPSQDDAVRDWVTASYRRLEEVGVGVYTGDADLLRRPDRFLSDDAFARLEAIRAARDPHGRFSWYLVKDGCRANAREGE